MHVDLGRGDALVPKPFLDLPQGNPLGFVAAEGVAERMGADLLGGAARWQ
jgi:hypothetical protein